MAEVFEGELVGELGFSRKIAIKRMLEHVASDVMTARRFLDEARIASKLHHANIVSVIDVGLLDSLPFQVLELVDGIDAHELQHRAGGTLPVDVALVLVNDVAHALDHAHGAVDSAGQSLGIVHRDVKPSNVLVSWNGEVKLTDFGIAVAHDRTTKTEAGLAPGTMGFMAPEQRTKSEVDGRTDVFALGLTLHAMIAGYTPLRDITVEVALLDGEPITLDAALPDDIRALIASAVAPDRRSRPTAAGFADALRAALVSRLHRDPRSHLRDYLAPLRGRQSKRGALDQLLGFDVVLASEPDGASPAKFELRPTAMARPAGNDAISTVLETPRVTIDEPTELDRPRRRGVLVVGAAVAALALGGVAVWQLAGRQSTEPNAERADAAAQVVALAPASDGGDHVEPDAALALPLVDAGAPPVDAHAATKHHVRDGGHQAVGAVVPADAAPPPPPRGSGYLQIVGEDNVGARVLVDGIQVGFAPGKLEVPLGKHRVEIVRKDGTRLASQAVEITEYDTLAHPVHPSW
jgi:serine/threonine-protein kinase